MHSNTRVERIWSATHLILLEKLRNQNAQNSNLLYSHFLTVSRKLEQDKYQSISSESTD